MKIAFHAYSRKLNTSENTKKEANEKRELATKTENQFRNSTREARKAERTFGLGGGSSESVDGASAGVLALSGFDLLLERGVTLLRKQL